ncbi:hypothetical protein FNF31_05819 [Cafeteria roenbergensis]|uniref:CAF1B/HIR1 beta-propeller domain-containing protein n=1 Tax=Cafeteria roenbergensis TaxID=33653 RepID=A0A5A8CVE2_CAFRO|nr:hypothetical protein FNF31_05819 [Cafeteria roenbergensis]
MKVHLIQIVWHRDKDAPFNAPIMSLHCHPSRNLLATAGQDKTVKVWRLVKESGKWGAQAVCELDCHERSVNCVRWSPCGTRLASCGDDKHIIVYTPREGHDWESVSSRRDVQVTTMSNNADTTDLAWSPDCVRLAVGGVDASVTIWDSGKREPMFVRKDHRSFVQGVAWDPAEELLASLSSDRSLALVRVPAVFGKPDAQGRRRRRRSAATVVPQRECPLIKSVSAPQLEDQGSAHAMLLAVATMDGVVVYDTAAGRALATAAHIHMERITDVSWAHDSALVAVASMDGYVSLLAMDPEEEGSDHPASAPAARKPKRATLVPVVPRAGVTGPDE